jgi:hypothetical protein
VVALVAAVPAQGGQHGTLVRPRPGLRSGGRDGVEEGSRLGARPQQPDAGVGVHPVLGRDLLQRERLEGVGVQVDRDVLVVAHEQHVGVDPQRQRMVLQRRAEQSELRPLRPLGAVVGSHAVGGQVVCGDVPPPPVGPAPERRQGQVVQGRAHGGSRGGDNDAAHRPGSGHGLISFAPGPVQSGRSSGERR